MKGIVFTEFLEMVEKEFGYETVDSIIEKSDLASNGVYTSVGTYEHSEMVQLVTNLSEEKGIPVPVLLKEYGKYLFDTFYKSYPQFFSRADTLFDFLESIHDYIHVEVQKLYPDAELPVFQTERSGNKKMTMIYQSERKMSDFAKGLIDKTIAHYEVKCNYIVENLSEDRSKVKFTFQIQD